MFNLRNIYIVFKYYWSQKWKAIQVMKMILLTKIDEVESQLEEERKTLMCSSITSFNGAKPNFELEKSAYKNFLHS